MSSAAACQPNHSKRSTSSDRQLCWALGSQIAPRRPARELWLQGAAGLVRLRGFGLALRDLLSNPARGNLHTVVRCKDSCADGDGQVGKGCVKRLTPALCRQFETGLEWYGQWLSGPSESFGAQRPLPRPRRIGLPPSQPLKLRSCGGSPSGLLEQARRPQEVLLTWRHIRKSRAFQQGFWGLAG